MDVWSLLNILVTIKRQQHVVNHATRDELILDIVQLMELGPSFQTLEASSRNQNYIQRPFEWIQDVLPAFAHWGMYRTLLDI
jgi:hypothetical protein